MSTPPPRTPSEPPPSTQRLGPFVLRRLLGRGGFAPVYLADEIHSGTVLRTAAVKLFSLNVEVDKVTGVASHPTGATGATAARRARIIEEARALCRVEHPNVVRFYALHTDDTLGVVGLVMEYVDGISLHDRIHGSREITPLTVANTIAVGEAIAAALVATHEAGLLHRDVKPNNIIESRGVYKLIDFGIASAEGKTGINRAEARGIICGDVLVPASGTLASMLIADGGKEASDDMSASDDRSLAGTIGYVDPVCMTTTAIWTPASDLYGLGVTLFECLVGLVPSVATGKSADAGPFASHEVMMGKRHAISLGLACPDAPSALVKLVDALLDPTREGRPRTAEIVLRTLSRIRGELAGRAHTFPPEDIGPFRGLGRFEGGDRDVFFGRASETATAVELLKRRGLVTLIGPSGSGKSSLARAGVAPMMTEGALGDWPKRWTTIVVNPGSDPYAALVAGLMGPFNLARVRSSAAVVHQMGSTGEHRRPQLLIRNASIPLGDALQKAFGTNVRLSSPEVLLDTLATYAADTNQGVLLVVDQLEELATVSEPQSRDRLVALLTDLAEHPRPGVRALAAGRRDLLDPLLALSPEFGRALTRGALLVSPLSDTVWVDVLTQALEAYGYTFETDSLRDEVIAQLQGTTGAMPLVQFALTELWSQRDRNNKRITQASLHAIGGIAGALERHADKTLERPELAGKLRIVRDVLLALTTLQGTRRTTSFSELRELEGTKTIDSVVAVLEDRRLVTREGDGYTLAHETLLTQWGKLWSWLEEMREDRLLAEEVERDAKKWSDGGYEGYFFQHDPSLLWRKRRLAAGLDLKKRATVSLTKVAAVFLREGRRTERRGWAALLVVGLLVLASAGVGIGFYIRDVRAAEKRATENERIANTNAEQSEQAKKTAETARTAEEAAKTKYVKELTDLQTSLVGANLKERERIVSEIAKKIGGTPLAPLGTPKPSTSASSAPARPIATGSPSMVPWDP